MAEYQTRVMTPAAAQPPQPGWVLWQFTDGDWRLVGTFATEIECRRATQRFEGRLALRTGREGKPTEA